MQEKGNFLENRYWVEQMLEGKDIALCLSKSFDFSINIDNFRKRYTKVVRHFGESLVQLK